MPPKRKAADDSTQGKKRVAVAASPKKKAAVVAKPERGQWACMVCTFFNEKGSTTCEMCGTMQGFGGITRTESGTVKDDDPPEVRLEFQEGKSSKFWQLKISGCTTVITFGKIGTAGQTDTKIHSNVAEAKKFASKIQAEKEKKGYRPV